MTTLQHPIAEPADGSHEHFVFYDVDWAFYDSVLRRLEDRRVFVTFDHGSLEIMSPSRKHGKCGRVLGLMINILADELDLPLDGGGSTTYRRQDLERGLEPDECFYIQNEARIRGKQEIDLSIDPPPDLAVEVEISRRLLDRRAIYATMGVPELWCHDGVSLRILVLDSDGKYVQADRSPNFPALPTAEVDRFVQLAWEVNETAWGRAFRAWVRQNLSRK